MAEQFKLTVKELITAGTILLSVAGVYFKSQSDLEYLQQDNVKLSEKVTEIEQKINTYSGLPQQVEELSIDIKANAKMVTVIHDGLVANGTIPPRR